MFRCGFSYNGLVHRGEERGAGTQHGGARQCTRQTCVIPFPKTQSVVAGTIEGCLWGSRLGGAGRDFCGVLNVLELGGLCPLLPACNSPTKSSPSVSHSAPEGRGLCSSELPAPSLACGSGTSCACCALPSLPAAPSRGAAPPDVFFIKDMAFPLKQTRGEWRPCSHPACLELWDRCQQQEAQRPTGLQGQGLPPGAGQVAPGGSPTP